MIDADNLHEAEQQALGQLAQMDLSLAAHLHAMAMNSDEPKEVTELTRAYQRAGRCVRQTIMLRSRLRHDHARQQAVTAAASRAAKAAADFAYEGQAPDPAELRIEGRTMDLQEAASRILAKAEPDLLRRERMDRLDRIDAWIDQQVEDRDEDFGLQDLDDHVLELCRALDLPEDLGRRFRLLPRAPWQAVDGHTPVYLFPPYDQATEPEHRDTG